MKIEYRVVGDTGGYQTLVDEGVGGVFKEFKVRGSIAKQNVALATSASQISSTYKQPFGNVTENFTLEVSNNYTTGGVGDRGLALQNARSTKQAFLTSKNNLKVSELSGTGEVQWYPNAVCASCEFVITGCEVTFTFQFEADLVTETEPS